MRAHAITLLLSLASLAFYSRFLLNHDTSWYLIATRKWLDGATLYRDVVEINPPLIFYITAIPVWVAGQLDVEASTVFVAFTVSLCALSMLWCARIISGVGLSSLESWALFLGLTFALIPTFFSEFGQREHLLVISSAPYLLQAALGDRAASRGRAEDYAIGALAFLGLALKPHFFLVPLLLYGLMAIQQRSWKPLFEPPNVALAVATVSYALFVAIFHQQYLSEILPLASLVYGSFGANAGTVFTHPAIAVVPVAIALLGFSRHAVDSIAARLAAICLGFLGIYFVQFKGWNYHALPLAAWLSVLVVWIAPRLRMTPHKPAVLGIFVFFVLFGTVGKQLMRGPYQDRTVSAFSPFVPAAGTPVLVLSSNVSAAFPFVNAVDGQWTSRYPAQWLVPGAISSLEAQQCRRPLERCRKLYDAADFARSTAVDDFLIYRPHIVFIDGRTTKDYFGGTPFDYLRFLGGDSRFAAIWHGYRQVGRAAGYTVWSRQHDVLPSDSSEQGSGR